MLNVNDVNQIYLGCQGENLARTIVINVKPWLVAHPNGVVTLYHKRNGSEEATPTGAEFDAEAGTVTWRPTSTDTYVFGEGEAEIRLAEGSVIKKSRKIKTDVAKAVTGGDGTDLESGWQGYLDAIEKAAQVAITKNGMIKFAVNSVGHLIFSYTDQVPVPADEDDTSTTVGELTWIDKDLGTVSAFGTARENGWTGTEALWTALQAACPELALKAESFGAGTRNGEDVDEDDPAYHNNAEYYAGQAAASATDAAGSADDAADSATAAAASAADALEHTQSTIETWLGNNIDPDSGYALDRTLSLQNAAAPADMVGGLKSDLQKADVLIDVDMSDATTGKYIDIIGNEAASSDYAILQGISLKKGQMLVLNARGYLTNVGMIYADYDSKKNVLVSSVDSTVREYIYKAEYDIVVGISYHISSFKNCYIVSTILESDNLNISKVNLFDATYGEYVDGDGLIQPASSYLHRNVDLEAGDTILLHGYGANGNVAMISAYESDSYSCLVLSDSASAKDYSYTALAKTTVTLSYQRFSEFYASVTKPNDGDAIQVGNYAKVFRKFAGIGDSLISGEIVIGQGLYRDAYNYSWLANLARALGSEYGHYSCGGLTTKTFMNNYGNIKQSLINSDTQYNAYFIALGTNDKNDTFPIGSISDAPGVDSFVGYYKQIIELAHTKDPHAVVFCVSLYDSRDISKPYSAMIKAISGLYNYCYYVPLSDYLAHTPNTTSIYANNSHFTALGYVYCAEVMKQLLSDITIKNASDFITLGYYDV